MKDIERIVLENQKKQSEEDAAFQKIADAERDAALRTKARELAKNYDEAHAALVELIAFIFREYSKRGYPNADLSKRFSIARWMKSGGWAYFFFADPRRYAYWTLQSMRRVHSEEYQAEVVLRRDGQLYRTHRGGDERLYWWSVTKKVDHIAKLAKIPDDSKITWYEAKIADIRSAYQLLRTAMVFGLSNDENYMVLGPFNQLETELSPSVKASLHLNKTRKGSKRRKRDESKS